jgi:hypothetical protein
MIGGRFLIQSSIFSWIAIYQPLKYSLKIRTGFHKTIVIVCLAITITLVFGSCKTCKCPAYSQIESKIPANMDAITI